MELPLVYHIGTLCMNFINCGTFSVLPQYAVWGGEAFYLVLVFLACTSRVFHHASDTQPLRNLHIQNKQNSEIHKHSLVVHGMK